MKHLSRTVSIVVICVLMAACASTPKMDPRVTALENQLSDLMSNSELASRGGDELKNAQRAMNQLKANFDDMDDEDLTYAVYATDRLIELAKYTAQARWFDDRREMLVEEQSKLVLEARTLEADLATARAMKANASAEAAQEQKAMALKEAEAARMMRDEALMAAQFAEEQKQLALDARAEAEALKAQAEAAATSALSEAEKAKLMAAAEAAKAEAAIAEAAAAKAAMQQLETELTELKAKQTDRGLVITLGDVLFEFNQADLVNGAARNLDPLVKALNKDMDQKVIVEGHTDNIGSQAYNLSLSEKRANSVKAYLVSQGIDGNRISTQGLGFEFPVANNQTNEGRQQNRRVEIILPQDEQ
ncbi:OmpA family protein [Marinicella litoralis]|uniref:Outer membrane protein OmpA-like peptidoglycan-associated protein n=1 Tax=Marinicella litoralis TaxID=644220 RepID=A0A4R6XVS4_9GAMM|nr:OmpA family protein [Marinicella litoralis]TDR22520.1 outer membrane protein OmpA-like peptidoglycan-associated protein [Marinicella litoralis]